MSNPENTKDRLLVAACEIFADKGFREATVAEICEKAGANIAAVNYHFGDKEKLYDAVWRHTFDRAAEVYPIDGKLPEHPSIEDYIFTFTRAILRRIFSEDETGYFAKLLCHEMSAPTLSLNRIAEEALFPQKQYLSNVIARLTGDQIDEHTLQLCLRSIIGQCAFYNFSRPLREPMLGKAPLNEQEIDNIAAHIATFSIGGIEKVLS